MHGRSVRHFRTLFLSDIHLGTRGCQAETLLAFLRSVEADTIYLVGDIVDGWALKRSWYWPQSHNDVVQMLLRKAQEGSRVIYVPGNHDECFRDYCGTHFGGVEVRLDDVHRAADGRRFLIVHGDAFDGVVKYARWVAILGDLSYAMLLRLNRPLNLVRRSFGFPYWSLSAYLKFKVKNAVRHVSDFESALAAEAHGRGVDGVVCGHIHHAEMRDDAGVLYINDGDWVESCTAAVEHGDGQIEFLRWTQPVVAGPPATWTERIDEAA